MLERITRWFTGKRYGYQVLFRGQDTRPVGKIGVILAELGQPEGYEFEFYQRYMVHLFRYVLPPGVRQIVLADRGTALIDPQHPLAHEPFQPRQLVDCRGSSTNREGKPYVECPVTWRPRGMRHDPWDYGYFLYRQAGGSGAPDICEKIGAKVVGWYFGTLFPEKKVPWRSQLFEVYTESVTELKHLFPHVEFRLAYYIDPDSMHQAVEQLLGAGCQTIVYQCFCNPIYSDFEDYGFALPRLHGLVQGRARVIMADQLGNQPAMRKAYLHLLHDQLQALPNEASVFVILSTHGHPFKRETMNQRAGEYRSPLTHDVQRLLKEREGRWDLAWSSDEYADPYWDPKNQRLATFDAYRQAIAQGYDYAIEIPTEFVAENTDLMVLHAMKKFSAFSEYDPQAPVPYPDWDRPLVRTFHEGQTTGIYASCPVGPYRRHVVQAVVDSVGSVLERSEPPSTT